MEIIKDIREVHDVAVAVEDGNIYKFEGIHILTTDHRYQWLIRNGPRNGSWFGGCCVEDIDKFIGAKLIDFTVANRVMSIYQWEKLVSADESLMNKIMGVEDVRLMNFLTDRGVLDVVVYNDNIYWRSAVLRIDTKVVYKDRV